MRDHILVMFHLASKLITLKFKLLEDVLIHLVLFLLHLRFCQLNVIYSCQRYNVNQLISYSVEAEKLRHKSNGSTHRVMTLERQAE